MANGLFGQLNQSFKAVWISNSGSVGRGVDYENLAPEQIAIFPADQYCGNGELKSLVTPNFKANKRLVLKQGIRPFSGQENPFLSRQDKKQRSSFEFEASDIVSWTGIKGSTGAKPEIVAIGYDGLDASKTLSKHVGLDAKPVYINLRLSGEPIKRYFHRNFIDHRILLDKHLCVGNCDCYDACGQVPCDLIADGLIKAINTQSLFVPSFGSGRMGQSLLSVPLRQFIKASKLKKCTEPIVAPTLKEVKKYTISLCDDGKSTLGKLAATVPNGKVVLESRVDSISTYSVWLDAEETAPTQFKLAKHIQPICDTCPTCGDEYTKVEGLKVVQVRVACGSDAPTVPGKVSSDLISSTLSGGDVYLIKVAKATTDEEIFEAAKACEEVSIVGIEGASCVGEEVTFDWVTCESKFKTTKKYMITLPDADCAKGESRLAELQAAYPDLVIADLAEGACMHSYETTVESNAVSEEQCEALIGGFKFKAPASFEGFNWVEYKTPVTEVSCEPEVKEEEPCCVCGVQLETAMWDHTTSECTFGWDNWDPNRHKPVRLQVNITTFGDYTQSPCDETKIYSTILQKLSLSKGTSGELVNEYYRSNTMLYEGKDWSSNPYVHDFNGFEAPAKAHLIYDQYTLRLKRRQDGDTHIANHQGVTDYVFYVPTGEGKQLENYINELVLSAGNPALKAVVL